MILGGVAGAFFFALLLWFFGLRGSSAPEAASAEDPDLAEAAMQEGDAGDAVAERAPLTEDDLAFVQRSAEALFILRFGDRMRKTAARTAEELPEPARKALKAFRRTFAVEPEQIDSLAVAFSDLNLGAWFGYRERVESYESRIARARSAALRNRLQSERQRLPKPAAPRMLARARLMEQADLGVLLAEVADVEEVESFDGGYLRFRMPEVFGEGAADGLAAVELNEGEIVFGHESLVKEFLQSPGAKSLAELGLNRVDLDGDLVASFFPTPASRSSVRGWLARRFASRDDPVDFAEVERTKSGFVRVKWNSSGDSVEVRAGVAGQHAGHVESIRTAVEKWIGRATPALDGLRGRLPVALADAVGEMLVGAVPIEDGLRVYIPWEMSSSALTQAGEFLAGNLGRAGGALAIATETAAARAPSRREASGRGTVALPARPVERTRRRQELSDGRIVSGAPLSTVATRTLRGWTMNILHAAIADRPVEGRVVGRTFRPDDALLESGVLKLRMDMGQASETVVEVHGIQRIGERLEGKVFEMPAVSGLNTPSVFFRWNDPTQIDTAIRRFYNRFALKLEFGEVRDGRISGKIFVAVHDVDKSFINGTFNAEIR